LRAKARARGADTAQFYGGIDVPIFLLALIDKGKKSDLSMAERNALTTILARIAETYREDASALARWLRGLE